MKKLNIRRLVSVSSVGGVAVLLFVPIIVQSYLNLKELSYPAIGLRELSEIEQQKLFLFNELGGNYREFSLLNKVINCESRWKTDAYNPKSKDYGLFQINQKSWDKKAKEMNLNYKENWEDNMKLGVWIYKNSGIQNWNWSKKCWSK